MNRVFVAYLMKLATYAAGRRAAPRVRLDYVEVSEHGTKPAVSIGLYLIPVCNASAEYHYIKGYTHYKPKPRHLVVELTL